MTDQTQTTKHSVAISRRRLNVGLFALAFNAALTSRHEVVIAQDKPIQTKPGQGKPVQIVALGDSLTAGYQLAPGESYPAQLERVLRARGHRVSILNAGVSGDTTAGGLDRLAWAVPADADAVIVALGANDMLRGLDPGRARSNLDRILTAIAGQKQDVLIAGMLASPSLPPDYRRTFDSMFPDLATKHGAILYPFFLDGIALEAKLNLADGLHPNARGVAVMVERSLPKVEELITRVQARRGALTPG